MKIEVEVPDGSQTPRLFYAPWGDEPIGDLGQEAIDLAAMAGLHLDPWQQWWMRHACSISKTDQYFNKYTGRWENKWAALMTLLIVARQNGKGSLLEARELAGLFLFGERLLVHSAHQFATSKEAFLRIIELIDGTPELRKELPKNGIMRTSGDQGITLLSGQRLLFKARSGRSIRGFTGDFLVLDECMYLSADEVAAMMPSLAARPNTQIWLTGSAGDIEVGDCSQMGHTRARALEGGSKNLLFAEWSADVCNDFCPPNCKQHDKIEDPATWAKANPGQGMRIQPDFIQLELEEFPRRKFLTERLSVGFYPVDGEAWKVIPKSLWMLRQDIGSQLEGDFALAVDVTPDRKAACLAVSGPAAGHPGFHHVEITGDGTPEGLDHRDGTQWVVPRILEIWKAQKPSCVIIDPSTHAGLFIDELEQAGVKVIKAMAREYAQACGLFRSAVVPEPGEQPTLVHIGQPALAKAIAEADTRVLTEMWAWDKRASGADISPLVAATLALWGFKKHVHTQKNLDFDFFFA